MRIIISSMLLLMMAVAGCSPEQTEVGPTAGVDKWLPLKVGTIDIQAQVALTPQEQRQGLMHRTELEENSGMLFPYREPVQLSFWMRNTRIPLDIGFFDGKGTLVEVYRMVPNDINQTQSRAFNLQYALEMNAGWFSKNKIYPGERMDLQLLADALRKRGADPALFGIAE